MIPMEFANILAGVAELQPRGFSTGDPRRSSAVAFPPYPGVAGEGPWALFRVSDRRDRGRDAGLVGDARRVLEGPERSEEP